MSIVGIKRDRRKLGRPRHPSMAPTDTALRTRKTTLDELDKLVQIPRMPLSMKLEHLIAEVKQLRKKGDALGQASIKVYELYDNNIIESYQPSIEDMPVEDWNKLWAQYDH